MARPLELTPEVADNICQGLSQGLSHKRAAEAAGKSHTALAEWLARAPEGEPFASFAAKVKEASALGRKVLHTEAQETIRAAITGRHTRTITRTVTKRIADEDGELRDEVVSVERTEEVIPPSWQAAFRLLESQDAENYGRRQAIEHTGPKGDPIRLHIDVALDTLTEEELDVLERAAQRREGANPGSAEG